VTIHPSLLPPGWPRPRGYANGVIARGTTVFTGGLVGWNEAEQFAAGGITGQFRQILSNLVAVLAEARAGPQHLVRMTWYVVDIEAYRAELPAIGKAYREILGRNFPAMAVVQVIALVEPDALIEIEATAVIPDAHR
jgi:enamine deaminase RidA (YjgF/YER057c/UK114 family)